MTDSSASPGGPQTDPPPPPSALDPPPPPSYGVPPPLGGPPPAGPFGSVPQPVRTEPVSAFGRPMAKWWKRFVAIIIDGVVVGAINGILYAAIGLNRYSGGGLGLLVGLVYFGLLNGSSRGQSIGKLALSIQVRNENGGPLGVGLAVIRHLFTNVLFFLCILPWLLDGLSPLWDPRRQAWHDKLVKSVVVVA